MSQGAALFVDILLMLSLVVLTGLVLALHMKLRQFGREAMRVPALADDLTQAITTSRSTMQELMRVARTDGVRLEDFNGKANKTLQELVYVLDRAEKVLLQFDNHLDGRSLPVASSNLSSASFIEEPTKEQKKSEPLPQRGTSARPSVKPGRYDKEIYKPSSLGGTAAAYQASNSVSDNDVDSQESMSRRASEAEKELRRALGSSI